MADSTCIIGGCRATTIIARGLCESHYRKARRAGELENYPLKERVLKTCSIEGCGKPLRARGWCLMHWNRWKRHGSPFAHPHLGPAIPRGAKTAVCQTCGEEKPVGRFVKANSRDGGHRKQPCHKCHRARYPHVYRSYTDRNRIEKRLKALLAYGGRCACCGDTREYVLQLDHVYNDGKAHREEIGPTMIWWWLEKNGYPEGRFQVLCANCHIAKTKLGACPCQTSSSLCRPSLSGTTAEQMWNDSGTNALQKVA